VLSQPVVERPFVGHQRRRVRLDAPGEVASEPLGSERGVEDGDLTAVAGERRAEFDCEPSRAGPAGRADEGTGIAAH